jgi:mono/diheme cytochrome c family protein
MKQRLFFPAFVFCTVLFVACNNNKGGNDKSTTSTSDNTTTTTTQTDDTKGIGKFKDVQLTHPLDQTMVTAGENIYNVKCASCHKLTDEKLVGPGWKGVTQRRKPEWIMNFVTNTDEMIEKDTAAQKLLEVCLVRMPNQQLTDDDARHVLEFMRKNDGEK